jgi:tetratricopeptide (TPR) repeat protein
MHGKSYEENKSLAQFAYNIGDFDAEHCLRRAISDAKHLDKVEEEMTCIFYLSRILYVWGRYDEAANNYEHLRRYCVSKNDNNLLWKVLYGLSEISFAKGNFMDASRLATEALSIALNRERQKGISLIISDEGDIQYVQRHEISPIYEDKLSLKRHSIDNLNIGSNLFPFS